MAVKRKLFPGRRRSPAKKVRKMRRTRMLSMRRVVPDSKLVKLKYVQMISLNPAVNTTITQRFRANSIFAPDFDVQTGNHQPMGHDQWAIFYDHYAVVGAKIVVTFITSGGSAEANAAICGIRLADSQFSLTSLTTNMEQNAVKTRILTNSGASGKCRVTSTYSAKKFLGIKDIRDNIERVGAQFGSNPAEDAFFYVFAHGVNPSVDPGAINCVCEIYYTCLLTERRDLAAS